MLREASPGQRPVRRSKAAPRVSSRRPAQRAEGRGTQAPRPAIGPAGGEAGLAALIRPRCVVIRRRLEDTVKMAAVPGLVRRPLQQVGTGANPRGVCTTRAHPATPLIVLLSFHQVSGLLKRHFHRTAPAALQVTGTDAG